MYNETTPMNDNDFMFINLDYMDMMSDGDESMKKTMLEMLLEELPQELAKMRELLGTSNWKELSSVSHKMKSTLAFVGNDTMTNANKELETITKNGENTDRAPELIDTLEGSYSKVVVELKNVFMTL